MTNPLHLPELGTSQIRLAIRNQKPSTSHTSDMFLVTFVAIPGHPGRQILQLPVTTRQLQLELCAG